MGNFLFDGRHFRDRGESSGRYEDRHECACDADSDFFVTEFYVLSVHTIQWAFCSIVAAAVDDPQRSIHVFRNSKTNPTRMDDENVRVVSYDYIHFCAYYCGDYVYCWGNQ